MGAAPFPPKRRRAAKVFEIYSDFADKFARATIGKINIMSEESSGVERAPVVFQFYKVIFRGGG